MTLKLIVKDGKIWAPGPHKILSERERIEKMKKDIDALLTTIQKLRQPQSQIHKSIPREEI